MLIHQIRQWSITHDGTVPFAWWGAKRLTGIRIYRDPCATRRGRPLAAPLRRGEVSGLWSRGRCHRRPLPLPAEAKAPIVAAGAVLVSFGLARLLIGRVSGVARVL